MDEHGGGLRRETVIAVGAVIAQVTNRDALLEPVGAGGGCGCLSGALVHGDDSTEMYAVDAENILGPVAGAVGPDDGAGSLDGERPELSTGSLKSSYDGASASEVNFESLADPGSMEDSEGEGAPPLPVNTGGDAGPCARRQGILLPLALVGESWDRPAYWPYPGPGRPAGSAFNMRASLKDFLVTIFCRQAAASLALHDGENEAAEQELDSRVTALGNLRNNYDHIKDDVLATKALALRRSGSVGAVVKFKNNGARDSQARDAKFSIEVTLTQTEDLLVCCNRTAEDCNADGCAQRDTVAAPLTAVCAATRLTLPALIRALSNEIRVSAMQEGSAVLYGKVLCVVRRAGDSWPFAVFRRKPNGSWPCHACQIGAVTFTHARAAAEAVVDVQSESSDVDDGDNVRGAARGRRSPVFAKNSRPLVPTDASPAHHASVMRAASALTRVTLHNTPDRCPHFAQPRSAFCRAGRHEEVIEFGGGAVKSSVPY